MLGRRRDGQQNSPPCRNFCEALFRTRTGDPLLTISGAVIAVTTGHPRPRPSCKSALPAVSMMPARDRTCSTCCTRLVPAHCCLFSKHTTERVDATDHHHEPLPRRTLLERIGNMRMMQHWQRFDLDLP